MTDLLRGLWTLVLFPILLLASVAALIAYSHQSWLLMACITSALFFSVLRLVGASRAQRHVDRYREAIAATWNGEVVSVGPGWGRSMALSGVGLLVATAGVLLQRLGLLGWEAWVMLTLGLGLAALAVGVAARAPEKLLSISRDGLWDAKYGLLPWPQVEGIDLRDVVVRGHRMSWLEVRVQSHQRTALLMADRRRIIGGIARLNQGGAVIQYQLGLLDLHPAQALAAARGWWLYAKQGHLAEPVQPKEEVKAALNALDRARRRMRLATQLAVASFVMTPVALVADLAIGWNR